MTDQSEKYIGASTEVSIMIQASRQTIYQAFLDPAKLASWLPPANMVGHVHTFEPHIGGKIRMSLTYQDVNDSPDGMGGKSSEDTDTFEGEFVELIPDEKMVWVTKFESDDPDFAGTMTITWHLKDTDKGTQVTALCENIPAGIHPEDNEAGSRSSLENLAALFQ